MKWIIFIIITGTIGGLSEEAENESSTTELLEERELLTYFDTELLYKLGYEDTQKNIFISPASIKSILGLLWEGAEGKTASELEVIMHLTKNATVARERLHTLQLALKKMTDRFAMKTANAMFISDQLKPKAEYKDVAENKYFAAVQPVNFQNSQSVVKTINDWVSKKTEGQIPTLVTADSVTPTTQLMLVNAMFFKAKWLYNFPTMATQIQEFHTSETEKIYTYMMNVKGLFKHSYEPNLKAEVVQIPFKDHKYKFIVVLPRQKDGIDEVSRAITHNHLLQIFHEQDKQEVFLSLPRFKIESKFELTEPLSSIGAKTIFSDTAQLPNIIDGNKNLKVGTILHKASIDVDEEGVRAEAATAAAVVPLMSPYVINFIVDHPFLFFIYNSNSNVILFEGRLNKPQEATKEEYEQFNKQKPLSPNPNQNFDVRTQNIPLSSQQPIAVRSPNEQPIRTATHQNPSQKINYNFQATNAPTDRDAIKFNNN